jgi:hypothetical protein
MPRHGQAIVRYGGYEKPFLLAVPYFRIKRQLSDQDVEERMADFYRELEEGMKVTDTAVSIRATEAIPAQAVSLLFLLSKEPFTKISDMTKAAGFKSPVEVNKAISILEKHQYVRCESYRITKRGRKSVFAVLTEKAFSYPGVERRKGKGSFEHELYQHIVQKRLEAQGVEARTEGRIKGSGKAIDLLAFYKDRGHVALEICLHLENVIHNILEDFSAGANEVVIVTREQKDVEKVVRIVASDPTLPSYLDRITFRTIDEFFD